MGNLPAKIEFLPASMFSASLWGQGIASDTIFRVPRRMFGNEEVATKGLGSISRAVNGNLDSSVEHGYHRGSAPPNGNDQCSPVGLFDLGSSEGVVVDQFKLTHYRIVSAPRKPIHHAYALSAMAGFIAAG
jgi:hypothetical protein